MLSLLQKLTAITEHAFETLDLPIEHARVQVSGQAEAAQFQCNGAMPCARVAKKNPRQIAEEIIAAIRESAEAKGVFSELSVGGPGFINMVLNVDFVASHLAEMAQDERKNVPVESQGESVFLDYGGPNVAKAMHVGHLRSSIIGDALRRMMLAVGYNAVGDVHLGDWGTPMGMLVAHYEKTGEGKIFDNYNEDDPESVKTLMDDLVERYPIAAALFKEDEDFKREALRATKQIQDMEQPGYGIWKIIRDVSLAGIRQNFASLGVKFDLEKGESDAHAHIAPLVEDFKAKSVAVESDGALVVPVSEETDKKEMPPLILLKSDGAVLYGTTDLGTLVDRMQEQKPQKVVYVVDQRQSLHFEQVFRAARKGGIVPDDVELTHAGFGTMNGPDGKPFKTRAGGVMKLEDLIAMGIEKAKQRLEEAKLAEDMPAAEKEEIAKKVAIAAIKFADLQNNRVADYVFDLDRLTMFEGKTGPYLLYQAVRINSLLKKAQAQGYEPAEAFVLPESDMPLALLLTELPDQLSLALKNYTPHVLCDYAFKLAQEFSSFYGQCHILSEEDEDLRGSRLALCKLTHQHLLTVLGLLGIQVPERM